VKIINASRRYNGSNVLQRQPDTQTDDVRHERQNGKYCQLMMCRVVCCWQPIYLNLQLRTGPSGNGTASGGGVGGADGDVSVTAGDRVDDVTRRATDATANRHAPVRQVISVNGEEEDVDNINIHDFTTFEQEQLIGAEFIGRLKRKSLTSEEDPERKLQRNLSSFRSAVRAVLSTEAIMQAMRHYNHRSDSETEEDEDDRTPLPTDTTSRLDAGSSPPESPCCASGNPDVTSVPELPDVCQDNKPAESYAAVGSADSPLSVEKPDVLACPTLGDSVAKDGGVGVSEVQLAGHEAVRTDATTSDAASAAAPVVVNDALVSEACVDTVEMLAYTSSREAMAAVDCSDGQVLSEAGDEQVALSADDGADIDPVKPTDGLMTSTTEQRQTETTDMGCIQCCCVQ